ncbi:MAG: LysE family translocator [Chloroflexota bacterium]
MRLNARISLGSLVIILITQGQHMFHELLIFALVFVTSAATPGPDTMTIFSRSLSGGRFSAIPYTVGIVLAKLTLLTFVVLGLAVLAQSYGQFFLVLKFAGVAYLIWAGIRTWRKSAQPEAYNLAEKMSWRDSVMGYSLGISNPQAIIFYVALLPTVIDMQHINTATYFMLCTILTCSMLIIASTYALLADFLGSQIQSSRAQRIINRIAGSIMICIGIVVVMRR